MSSPEYFDYELGEEDEEDEEYVEDDELDRSGWEGVDPQPDLFDDPELIELDLYVPERPLGRRVELPESEYDYLKGFPDIDGSEFEESLLRIPESDENRRHTLPGGRRTKHGYDPNTGYSLSQVVNRPKPEHGASPDYGTGYGRSYRRTDGGRMWGTTTRPHRRSPWADQLSSHRAAVEQAVALGMQLGGFRIFVPPTGNPPGRPARGVTAAEEIIEALAKELDPIPLKVALAPRKAGRRSKATSELLDQIDRAIGAVAQWANRQTLAHITGLSLRKIVALKTAYMKEPHMTNAEIAARLDRIEQTLAIYLEDVARSAQRIAAKLPDNERVQNAVTDLLADIERKGR